jgi:hypothetical protein
MIVPARKRLLTSSWAWPRRRFEIATALKKDLSTHNSAEHVASACKGSSPRSDYRDGEMTPHSSRLSELLADDIS